MTKLLNRRVLRDLKANAFRYFALFSLIVLGMYLVISIVGAAEMVIQGVSGKANQNQVEDGEFQVFVPLTGKQITKLTKQGLTIQPEFYLDYDVKNHSVVRIFQNRGKINQIELDEGRLAKQPGEIVLEKLYAAHHQLELADKIEIGGVTFEVTGIGSSPDYDCAYQNVTDAAVDSNQFGVGFVCEDQYKELKDDQNYKNTECNLYSYRSNGKITGKELRKQLKEIKVSQQEITDPYLKDMIEEESRQKTELTDGIQKLTDGTSKLNDGLDMLHSNNEKLSDGINELCDGYLSEANEQLQDNGYQITLTEKNYKQELQKLMDQKKENPFLKIQVKSLRKNLDGIVSLKNGMNDYLAGESKAAKGASSLDDGMKEFKEKTDEILERNFPVEIENLIQLIERGENPRIEASVDDVEINRLSGLVAGVIIMILFTYVISVFVIHNIEKETTVIGALYSLGVKKGELILHYLMLPIVITGVAGALGTWLGFSGVGVTKMAEETMSYYSIPKLEVIYPTYLLVYGIIMPVVVAVIVNFCVINKKLSQPALKMLRNEGKQAKFRTVNLKHMGFVRAFQIRQFFREIRTSVTVVFGMFISLLIFMLGVDCYMLCNHTKVQNKQDTKYEYMYTYKYPTKEVPKGGEAAYAETLKKEIYGYNLDVTLLGIRKDNPYFPDQTSVGKDEVTVSTSTAVKYHLKEGQELILTDPVKEEKYAFTVKKIVPYSVGLYVFMDLDSMRELFGQEEDYYNVVFSDHDLKIPAGRLYATTRKEEIEKGAAVFVRMMKPMVISMIGSATVIFLIVMYLMMKVMIDRSSFHISLMKIFGMNQREIRRLYLDGNFVLVALSALLCIPLSKVVIDAMYPYFVSNVACGMDLSFPNYLYVEIYAGVLLCYVVINQLLVGRLKKMVPAEVLKNRE